MLNAASLNLPFKSPLSAPAVWSNDQLAAPVAQPQGFCAHQKVYQLMALPAVVRELGHEPKTIMGDAGFMLLNAPDVGTALRDLVQHLDLHDRGRVAVLQTRSRVAQIGYAIHHPGAEATDQIYDLRSPRNKHRHRITLAASQVDAGRAMHRRQYRGAALSA
jgi:hypothetical protein